MGGEKYPVMVYGPTEKYDMTYWLIKLNLIDIHECAKNIRDLRGIEDNNDKDIKNDIELCIEYYKINGDDYNTFFDFCEKNNLTNVFFNSYDWTEFSIGFEVKNFEDVTKEEMDKVTAFCEKYNLTRPTFFAGLVGEFE